MSETRDNDHEWLRKEDVVTTRIKVDRFVAGWPYEPEDLRADAEQRLRRGMPPRRGRPGSAAGG